MNIKQDNEIMRLLKVEYISHPIVNTSKGMLSLNLRKNEEEYKLLLDSVPVEKETEYTLMKLIYGKNI